VTLPSGCTWNMSRTSGVIQAAAGVSCQSPFVSKPAYFAPPSGETSNAFTASQYPTPAGLKADGLRYQGIARVYEQLPSNVPVSGGSDFAWSDWAIGVGAGIGIALLLGVGLVIGRQQRHRVQPA